MKKHKLFAMTLVFTGCVVVGYMLLWGGELIFEITFNSKLAVALSGVFATVCGVLHQWYKKRKLEKQA